MIDLTSSSQPTVDGGQGVMLTKADLAAKLKVTVRCIEHWQRDGYRFGHKGSPRTITCVQGLYNLVREDRERFERLWPLIAELHPDEPMTEQVVKGLWVVDKWLGKEGRSVTESPYREKLLALGGKGLNHEIRREIALIGQGGVRVNGCAIAKYLNKQRIPAHLKIQLS